MNKPNDEFFRQIFSHDFIIDVRSPREFSQSHIPNAKNLPIFSDEEFSKIGILYKQNALEANFYGASLACKNIAKLLENHRDILNHKFKILIYCARGGNRSLALYSILNALKLRVTRLNGGYKYYRNCVVKSLQTPPNARFITLCGNTGCGKSELILLAKTWSIDLEKLACHYGSSFGFMAGIQPSQKAFENDLARDLMKTDLFLIENESKKLGSIIIPNALYSAYQNGFRVEIRAPLEYRIKRTLNLYKNISESNFLFAMEKISPYIKKEAKIDILDSFKRGDLNKTSELLLSQYYDKTYRKIKCDCIIESSDISRAYSEILALRDEMAK